LLVAPGRPALWRAFGGGAANATASFNGPYPSAIGGLAGWWDAGTYSGLLDASGNPLPSRNNAIAAVADKSGNGNPVSAYRYSGSGGSPQATARLNGQWGGAGRNLVIPPAVPSGGMLLPQMDPDSGFVLSGASLGSGIAWTIYLVWSRPNFAQNAAAAQIALLAISGTVVLAADAGAGSNQRLILFPGSSQSVLTSALERRHTHSIVIRNTPGVGVDVWLDGGQVLGGGPNPLASSLAGSLLILHSGNPAGGAQCWFHEAALWSRAISASDISTLLAAATRWLRGPRKGVQLVVMGQSNAGYSLTDGAWHLLAQGIAWHLGALAFNVIGAWSSGTSYTCISGHGISNEPFSGSVVYPGSFLADPGDGSSPAGWQLGADGQAVQTYLAAQEAADLNDVSLLVWPWTETDSARPYAEKAYYESALTRLVALTRNMLSRSAASLPLMLWNAIPFGSGTDSGTQMAREAVADVVASSGLGIIIGLPQTADSNPRGATWNPATGVSSGGDFNHRDATDNLRFGRLAAPVAARAVLAATGGDTETAIPAGIPSAGGPRIAHVYQAVAHSTTLVLTITHDAGSDLVVPLLAASGQGFAVMDGGSVANPGPMIPAVACTRVDPTHLQLTLASAPSNSQSGLLLFYPYGSANIFRGNAVTDNYASVTKPAGWDIGNDLGSAWALDYPLAATATPAPVSATPG
jgi:hypothetical protein